MNHFLVREAIAGPNLSTFLRDEKKMRGRSGRVKTVHQRPRVSRLANLRNGESCVGRIEIIESIIKTLKPLDFVDYFFRNFSFLVAIFLLTSL